MESDPQVPGREEQEDAAQQLTELSEELGLYDEPPEDIVDDEPSQAPRCPFCGLPMPCPSHRMGGPA